MNESSGKKDHGRLAHPKHIPNSPGSTARGDHIILP